MRMKGLIMDLKESCPKTYEDLFTFSFPDGWVLPWLMAQRNKAIIGKVLSVFPICMLKLSITTMWNCHKYIFLLICWVNLPWWGHILFIDAVLESCSLAFHPPSSCFCTEDGSEFPSACRICLLLLKFKIAHSQPKTWPCKTLLTQTVSMIKARLFVCVIMWVEICKNDL